MRPEDWKGHGKYTTKDEVRDFDQFLLYFHYLSMVNRIKKSALVIVRLITVLYISVIGKSNCCGDFVSASEYVVITDSINIKTNKYIGEACEMILDRVEKYRGNYICLFNSKNYTYFPDYGSQDKRYIFSIAPGSDSLVSIKTFDNCDQAYFDFFARKDTLFYRSYYYGNGYYYNNRKNRWEEAKHVANICYEDDDYIVSYLPYGEWGTYTSFYDKKTGLKHLFRTPMNKIIKYDDAYYIISAIAVYKILDPRKGYVKNDSVNINNMYSLCPEPERVFSTKYKSIWELEFSFDDNNMTQDTFFVSGYVDNGLLYLINESFDDLFVVKCDKDLTQKEKIFSLRNITTYDGGMYKLARSWDQTGYLSLIHDKDKCGILDIHKDTIRLTYVNTQIDTLQYIGKSSLMTMMDFLSESLGKITLDEVKAFEKGFGGKTDGYIYGSDRNAYFPQHKKSNYQITKYYHAIDNVTSYEVEYCYNKNTQMVVSAFIEFAETRIFKGNGYVWEKKKNITGDEIKKMVVEYVGQDLDSNRNVKKGKLTYHVDIINETLVIY